IDGIDAEAASRILATRPEVRFVEDDRPLRVVLRAVPDDTLYDQEWYLHETSLSAPQATIHADAAWDVSRGVDVQSGAPVRVAVIDDGFDLGHPDLSFAAERIDLSQQ